MSPLGAFVFGLICGALGILALAALASSFDQED